MVEPSAILQLLFIRFFINKDNVIIKANPDKRIITFGKVVVNFLSFSLKKNITKVVNKNKGVIIVTVVKIKTVSCK